MTAKKEWMVIGRFGRPHGIKGFVSIHSFTEPRENILQYKDWHVYLNKQWQPVRLQSVAVHNKAIIALVEGYTQREQAQVLTNAEIAMHPTQLAALGPDEYYWHQLVGMRVVGQHGEVFGEVVDLMATGSNDVLVVQGEKRYLIPYLPGEFVLSVDKTHALITVNWDLDF